MLDNLKYDTSIVNPEAENLISCANEFGSVISSLIYIGNQIQTNWEGDGADITGVLDSINNVSEYYETKIIPAMSKLGNGMLAFSDALNEVTNSTLDQTTTVNSDINQDTMASSSNNGGRDALSKRKWGEWDTFSGDYWSAVGQDFAENWNYSNCDNGIEYVFSTIGGTGSTLLDTVETGLEIGGDILSSSVSAVGNALETAWNWFY